jgi:hypothetical protein
MTHSSMSCSQLPSDLKEGFYKPAGGYQGDDDCDDSLSACVIDILKTIFSHTLLKKYRA